MDIKSEVIEIIDAVSYTHLDVYKRQLWSISLVLEGSWQIC